MADLRFPSDAPLIVAYGSGVDSTAMLIALRDRGIRPDLVMFADTGGEKPETISYLDTMDAWLEAQGFPTITRVRYHTSSAPYADLEGNCLSNETLPSLAFGRHSCSLKWKAQPQDYYVKGCARGPNKREPWAPAADAWARGAKPVKLIGYDASPADCRRSGRAKAEDEWFRYRFPLQELGLTRPECIALILQEGLPVPIKSACWFCPASKKWELYWLAAEHPELFLRALRMEVGFRTGKWYRPKQISCVRGLGRTWSWTEWALEEGIIDSHGNLTMAPAELRRRALETKPAQEANTFKTIPITVQTSLFEEATCE